MSRSSRRLAFLSYLLGPLGALYVLLARRDDAFAVFHARQSLALAVVGLAAPLGWAVLAWGLAWIPLVGGMFAVVLFTLVLAIYSALVGCWLAGMRYSLQGRARLIPLVGARSVARPPRPAADDSAELQERRAIKDI